MTTWQRSPMPLRVVRRARRRLPDPTPLDPRLKSERTAPIRPPSPPSASVSAPDPGVSGDERPGSASY